MILRRTRALAAIVATLAVAAACHRDRDKATEEAVGTTTTTSATVDSFLANDATAKLVEARCSQEQLCAEMGGTTSRRPTSCADDVRNAIGDMLTAECPQGIGRRPVDACAAALRTGSCDVALLAKTIPPACRSEALCASVH